jgi:hypothetical protein
MNSFILTEGTIRRTKLKVKTEGEARPWEGLKGFGFRF